MLHLDALFLTIIDQSGIRNTSVYLALGINMHGAKELLGFWLSHIEGARFWLQVLSELKIRGVQDIFVVCVDGLSGFPGATESIFPQTEVQLCIVHMVRDGLNYVSSKERKDVDADLKRG